MNRKNRLFLSLALFIFVLIIGVTGFKILGGEDWSLLDSLYMTVITLSTVGYEEVSDLNANPAARVFAVVFILLCVGTIAFAVSSITSFIVEGELKNILGRKKMEKRISKLRDHYIICGVDETAQTIIEELVLTQRPFVVVDPLQENLDKLASFGDILFMQGDPAEDDVLISAGIAEAKGILLSLPTDEANLFVTLTARSLSPDIRIVTKGIHPKSHKKIKKAGANAVVSPSFIGGMRMVSEMVRPAVVSLLDKMLRERDVVRRVEEVSLSSGSRVIGKTIADSKIAEVKDVLLVALKRTAAEAYEFKPSAETVLQENDVLFFITTPEGIKEVEKIVGGN
ncbi:MAG: potassium channel protein [Candidatus Aminicenantes bacterium]|jgi:voltage-gated potassium channel